MSSVTRLTSVRADSCGCVANCSLGEPRCVSGWRTWRRRSQSPKARHARPGGPGRGSLRIPRLGGIDRRLPTPRSQDAFGRVIHDRAKRPPTRADCRRRGEAIVGIGRDSGGGPLSLAHPHRPMSRRSACAETRTRRISRSLAERRHRQFAVMEGQCRRSRPAWRWRFGARIADSCEGGLFGCLAGSSRSGAGIREGRRPARRCRFLMSAGSVLAGRRRRSVRRGLTRPRVSPGETRLSIRCVAGR
jgi:hypothetical protein